MTLCLSGMRVSSIVAIGMTAQGVAFCVMEAAMERKTRGIEGRLTSSASWGCNATKTPKTMGGPAEGVGVKVYLQVRALQVQVHAGQGGSYRFWGMVV